MESVQLHIRKRHGKQFNFMSIINEEKWNSFDNTDALIDLSRERSNLKISDVK